MKQRTSWKSSPSKRKRSASTTFVREHLARRAAAEGVFRAEEAALCERERTCGPFWREPRTGTLRHRRGPASRPGFHLGWGEWSGPLVCSDVPAGLPHNQAPRRLQAAVTDPATWSGFSALFAGNHPCRGGQFVA